MTPWKTAFASDLTRFKQNYNEKICITHHIASCIAVFHALGGVLQHQMPLLLIYPIKF